MQSISRDLYDVYRSNAKYIKVGDDYLPNPYYVDVNKLEPEPKMNNKINPGTPSLDINKDLNDD